MRRARNPRFLLCNRMCHQLWLKFSIAAHSCFRQLVNYSIACQTDSRYTIEMPNQ
jgi:hypothetical protein